MKSTVEKNLLAALTELENGAAKKSADAKPDFQEIFSRIDELARQLPPDADPELRHFLQRKSYQKARLHLLQIEN